MKVECQRCHLNEARCKSKHINKERVRWCKKCKNEFKDEFEKAKLELKEKLKNLIVNKQCNICGDIVETKYFAGFVICSNCKKNGKSSNFFKTKNDKAADTIKKHYGVNNGFLVKADDGTAKRDNTCIQRYGVKSPLQNKEIFDKVQSTNFKKYGVKNLFEDTEKLKKTWFEKYGVTNPNKTSEIRDKIEKTNIERYGTSNPAQCYEIKAKTILTNLKRYGYAHVLQVPEVMAKRFDEKHLKYSKIHAKLKEAIVKEIPNQLFKTECIITCVGKHFSVDEYDKYNKIIIFVDGDYWHANPLKYSDDYYFSTMNKTAAQIRIRDYEVSNILQKNGYEVLRFWENEIKKDLKQCIFKIANCLNNCKGDLNANEASQDIAA